MKVNLESTRGLIVAEAVMMEMATFIGRQEVHEIVYGACVSALDNDMSLLEVLREIKVVTSNVAEDKLA